MPPDSIRLFLPALARNPRRSRGHVNCTARSILCVCVDNPLGDIAFSCQVISLPSPENVLLPLAGILESKPQSPRKSSASSIVRSPSRRGSGESRLVRHPPPRNPMRSLFAPDAGSLSRISTGFARSETECNFAPRCGFRFCPMIRDADVERMTGNSTLAEAESSTLAWFTASRYETAGQRIRPGSQTFACPRSHPRLPVPLPSRSGSGQIWSAA